MVTTTAPDSFIESPYARAIVATADLWSGTDALPSISEDEYMRGMVETLATALAPQDGRYGDEIKDAVHSDLAHAWQVQERGYKSGVQPRVHWQAGIVAVQTGGQVYFSADGGSAVVLADPVDDTHHARAYYVDSEGRTDTATIEWAER